MKLKTDYESMNDIKKLNMRKSKSWMFESLNKVSMWMCVLGEVEDECVWKIFSATELQIRLNLKKVLMGFESWIIPECYVAKLVSSWDHEWVEKLRKCVNCEHSVHYFEWGHFPENNKHFLKYQRYEWEK